MPNHMSSPQGGTFSGEEFLSHLHAPAPSDQRPSPHLHHPAAHAHHLQQPASELPAAPSPDKRVHASRETVVTSVVIKMETDLDTLGVGGAGSAGGGGGAGEGGGAGDVDLSGVVQRAYAGSQEETFEAGTGSKVSAVGRWGVVSCLGSTARLWGGGFSCSVDASRGLQYPLPV